MGERLVRNEEVTGSIPVISTILFWAVLHGAVAAPSRPQSAIAGWNAPYEAVPKYVLDPHVAVKVRSRATRSYELRQDRKVATVSNRSSVPRGSLAGAVDEPRASKGRSRRGARP